MRFSIVIPVYNVERYLEECLASVLAQPAELVFEIILVDDGSTDSSGAICDRYAAADSRIKVLHKKNESPYQARISGIKQAAGDYVLFVDSDDSLPAGAVPRIEALLAAHAWPDVLVYGYTANGTAVPSGIDGSLINKTISGRDKYKLYELLCGGDELNAMWRKCIRRTVLERAVWSAGVYINSAEDAVLSCQALDAAGSVCIVEDPLYEYRMNPESLTRIYTYAQYASRKKAFGIMDEYAKKWDAEFKTDALQKLLFSHWTGSCIEWLAAIVRSGLPKAERHREIDRLYQDEVFVRAIRAPRVETADVWQKYIAFAARRRHRTLALDAYVAALAVNKTVKAFLRDCLGR